MLSLWTGMESFFWHCPVGHSCHSNVLLHVTTVFTVYWGGQMSTVHREGILLTLIQISSDLLSRLRPLESGAVFESRRSSPSPCQLSEPLISILGVEDHGWRSEIGQSSGAPLDISSISPSLLRSTYISLWIHSAQKLNRVGHCWELGGGLALALCTQYFISCRCISSNSQRYVNSFVGPSLVLSSCCWVSTGDGDSREQYILWRCFPF